ncbi:MAG: hypothetical protein M3401_13505 [Actinomycetota bacterium]|nr:hypothetical protein [Actinomycetota bacterium]
MKTRDRLVLGILALAGLMAALWFGVLAPKREEAASLSDKVTAAEQRRDAANTKAAKAEQARATYGRDYATVARLGKATPPQADVPSLVYQLESAARHAKVDFRAVSLVEQPVQAAPAPSPDGKKASDKAAGKAASDTAAATAANPAVGITPVAFTFMFEGSFFKLHELLRSVDRFSRLKGQTVKIKGRLLTLDSVKLTASRKGFPRVKVEITARAYVAPIPDQLPGSGEPSTASSPTPTTATQVTK